MGKILRKLNVLLDKKQKRIMVYLIFVMLVGAALELLGVGMILEAVTVITDPDILEKNGMLADIYGALGMGSMTEFSMVLLGALIVVYAVKNA